MLIDTVALGQAVAPYITEAQGDPDEFDARMRITAEVMKIADAMADRPWFRADNMTLPDETPVWAFCPDLGALPFEARSAKDIREAQVIYVSQYTYWIMERTLQSPPTPPSVATGPNVTRNIE